MIKPFTIKHIRDEEHGCKTVFFEVTRVEILAPGRVQTSKLETSFHIDAGKDVEEELFRMLTESGWI